MQPSPATSDKVCERCHQIKRVADDVCPDDGGRLYSVSDENALLGRVIDGKLTLTAVLGKGGMGVVYRARQHSMDREVAVKVLHPGFAGDTEAVRRFLHEARAATRLEHPNVITVFDFGRTDDGLLYIVMELLNGTSLAAEVEKGPIAPARAVHLLTQVADAVHHAHERGLVHRDLKPENVVLVQGSSLRGDFVKVLDFGIAMMRSYDGIERITRTGAVCGTPAYMSPEQVLGDEVDRRSDVYALGVIAYEMLAGVHPLPADTPMRQMLAHLETPVPPLIAVAPHIPVAPKLEQAVLHALEKKRDLRTPSALAFANELVEGLGGGGLMSPVLGVPLPRGEVAATITAAPRAKSSDHGDKRGFADTARATASPAYDKGGRSWKWLPYAAVLAVLVLAVVFLATRPDGNETPGAQVGPAVPMEGLAIAPAALPTAPKPTLAAQPAPAPAPTHSAAPAPAPAAVPKPVRVEPVTVVIGSAPASATVLAGDVVLGLTPLPIAFTEGQTRELVIKKAGYKTQTRTVAWDSGDVTVTLDRLPKKPGPSDSPGIVR